VKISWFVWLLSLVAAQTAAQEWPSVRPVSPSAGLPATAESFPWEGESMHESAAAGENGEEGEEPREEGDEDELETDRDSFTPATTTAGCHRLIIESAYSFLDNRRVAETHSFPETLLRYGISDRVELRFGYNYEVGGAANSISSGGDDDEFQVEEGLEREGNLAFGMKAVLSEQELWRPQTAFIIQGATPTMGKETATQLVSTYAFGWRARNGSKWDSAIRYAYDSAEGDHFNIWAPSTVLKVPVADRWNVHAEYFGIFSDGRERNNNQQYVSPGIHCLLSNDYELGVRVGWGLNDRSADCFVNAGFGCRY